MSKEFEIGTIGSLWRYPVKSMAGEGMSVALLEESGFVGDRSYAIIDEADGKVATAKNPKKWSRLLNCQATLGDSDSNGIHPFVSIKLPDGTIVTTERENLNQKLSQALGREVFLAVTQGGKVNGVQSAMSESWVASSEEYSLNFDQRSEKETVTDFELPEGTFFDCARVHLLTTSTLARLNEIYPEGRFGIQRFRPNIVVESNGNDKSFVENDWIGHTLIIGDEVRLKVSGPCPRCVMTTLPQANLPKDTNILRTAVQHNHGNVGVYATVVQSGTIRQGDAVQAQFEYTGVNSNEK